MKNNKAGLPTGLNKLAQIPDDFDLRDYLHHVKERIRHTLRTFKTLQDTYTDYDSFATELDRTVKDLRAFVLVLEKKERELRGQR